MTITNCIQWLMCYCIVVDHKGIEWLNISNIDLAIVTVDIKISPAIDTGLFPNTSDHTIHFA